MVLGLLWGVYETGWGGGDREVVLFLVGGPTEFVVYA